MENIAEILKNAPEGLILYSLVHGDVTLKKGINTNNNYPVITTYDTDNPATFTKYGKFINDFEDAECVLFPSKEHKSWDNWQEVLFQVHWLLYLYLHRLNFFYTLLFSLYTYLSHF